MDVQALLSTTPPAPSASSGAASAKDRAGARFADLLESRMRTIGGRSDTARGETAAERRAATADAIANEGAAAPDRTESERPEAVAEAPSRTRGGRDDDDGPNEGPGVAVGHADGPSADAAPAAAPVHATPVPADDAAPASGTAQDEAATNAALAAALAAGAAPAAGTVAAVGTEAAASGAPNAVGGLPATAAPAALGAITTAPGTPQPQADGTKPSAAAPGADVAAEAAADGMAKVAATRVDQGAKHLPDQLALPDPVKISVTSGPPANQAPAPAPANGPSQGPIAAPQAGGAPTSGGQGGTQGQGQGTQGGAQGGTPGQAAAAATSASATAADDGATVPSASAGAAAAGTDPTAPAQVAPSAGTGSAAATPATHAGNQAAALPRWAVPGLPVAQQVAAQFASGLAAGSHQYDIQLDPLELGRVRVRLEVGGDGAVSAAISADRPDTLALLRNDARHLQQALQDAGLNANSSSLDFSLSGQRRDGGMWSGTTSGGAPGGFGEDGGPAGGVEVIAATTRTVGADRALDIQV